MTLPEVAIIMKSWLGQKKKKEKFCQKWLNIFRRRRDHSYNIIIVLWNANVHGQKSVSRWQITPTECQRMYKKHGNVWWIHYNVHHTPSIWHALCVLHEWLNLRGTWKILLMAFLLCITPYCECFTIIFHECTASLMHSSALTQSPWCCFVWPGVCITGWHSWSYYVSQKKCSERLLLFRRLTAVLFWMWLPAMLAAAVKKINK